MSIWQLTLSNLRYHLKIHIWIGLGIALCVAILVGALMLGDSVQWSIAQLQNLRLGKIQYAMKSLHSMFRPELAASLRGQYPVAAVFHIQGTAISDDQKTIVQVQIWGIDDYFQPLMSGHKGYEESLENSMSKSNKFLLPGVVPHQAAWMNTALAQRLHAELGQEIVIRFAQPSFMPWEAPLSQRQKNIGIRLPIQGILPEKSFGQLQLEAQPKPVYNIFVNRQWLLQVAQCQDQANLLFIGETQRIVESAFQEELAAAVQSHWTLDDMGLSLTACGINDLELRSSRIFISPELSKIALSIDATAQGSLVYFVNALNAHDKSVPYSFVASVNANFFDESIADDALWANTWLANELGLQVNDTLELRYWTTESFRVQQEQGISLRVSKILPIQGFAADSSWMPQFPGLANTQTCKEWNPGIPIETQRIRPQDEQYWQQYKGTPKAWISLQTAQRIWGNRFGNLTSIRYPGAKPRAEQIKAALQQKIHPNLLGFQWTKHTAEARQVATTVDFGFLFLCLSFVLIVSGLLTVYLLLSLHLEHREPEVALLLSLGFRHAQIQRLIFAELAGMSLIACVLGIGLGWLYGWTMIVLLQTFWKAAIGALPIEFHGTGTSIFIGSTIALALCWLSVWIPLRKLKILPMQIQQKSSWYVRITPKKQRMQYTIIAFLGLAIFSLLSCSVLLPSVSPTGFFFGMGGFMLILGIVCCNTWLRRHRGESLVERFSLFSFSIANAARNSKRSVTVVLLMAVGIFMVIAVAAHQPGEINWQDRSSGTGGFSLYAETGIPIVHDLNQPEVLESSNFPESLVQAVHFIPIRMHGAHDASCLNLQRIAAPKILGIPCLAMDQRQAFSLAQYLPQVDPQHFWNALESDLLPNQIPAFIDQNVLLWGLGKKLGDSLFYQNEFGQTIELKLIACLQDSIFQGSVIISNTHFQQHFPSQSGAQVLLIECDPAIQAEVQGWLESHDWGMEVETTRERWLAFKQVEHTYLSIFLALGGLGIILGSLGLGIVLLWTLEERKSELALLYMLGFDLVLIERLILFEHVLLLGLACGIGMSSAILAIFPTWTRASHTIPYFTIVLILGILVIAALWSLYLGLRSFQPNIKMVEAVC